MACAPSVIALSAVINIHLYCTECNELQSAPEVIHIGARADKAQETRKRILTAALSLFEERGFTATTVDDIAALAGVSRRTVFYQFPTKEDLVLVDHAVQLDFLLERIDQQPVDLPTYDVLWNALEDLGNRFDRSKPLRLRHRFVVNEPDVHARSLQMQSEWDDRIAAALAARSETPRATAVQREAAVVSAAGLACLRSCARRSVTDPKAPGLRAALAEARRVLAEAASTSRVR